MPNTMSDITQTAASSPTTQEPSAMTSFLHKVGAPIAWIAVGYLIATITQRPRRSAA